MRVYGAVFARGGSKGVRGKNLRQLGGRSLLGWAITAGQDSGIVDRIFVSTDADDIIAEAQSMGAEVPFRRPAELSTDDSPEWEAWQHLAHYLIGTGADESDLLVSIPTTSPLRASSDIDKAIEKFFAGGFDLVLAVTESARSPWFNMVRRQASGGVELAVSAGTGGISRRQDAPPVFDITTVVYVTTLGFVVSQSQMFDGVIGSILVPRERAVDVDTELDLEIAECLALKRLGWKSE